MLTIPYAIAVYKCKMSAPRFRPDAFWHLVAYTLPQNAGATDATDRVVALRSDLK